MKAEICNSTYNFLMHSVVIFNFIGLGNCIKDKMLIYFT